MRLTSSVLILFAFLSCGDPEIKLPDETADNYIFVFISDGDGTIKRKDKSISCESDMALRYCGIWCENLVGVVNTLKAIKTTIAKGEFCSAIRVQSIDELYIEVFGIAEGMFYRGREEYNCSNPEEVDGFCAIRCESLTYLKNKINHLKLMLEDGQLCYSTRRDLLTPEAIKFYEAILSVEKELRDHGII